MRLPRNMRRVSDWLVVGWGLGCILVLVTMALLGLAVQSIDAAAERQADTMAARLAVALAQDAAGTLGQLDRVLQGVIGGRQSPASEGLSAAERAALLAERVPHDRYLDFVEVLGPDGGVLASTSTGHEAFNWGGRDYFLALRRPLAAQPYIGSVYAMARPEKGGITVGRRITDGDGQFAGVVVAGVQLAYFRDVFSQLGLGPHDSVTLFSDNGTILMRVPFSPNDIGRAVDNDAPFTAFARSGASAVTSRDPADRIERHVVFRRVGPLPLVIGVAIATQTGIGWWLAVLGAAVLAVAWYFGYRWWREARGRVQAQLESREKSRFLTTLSHELRTPLHGVLGYAEQLAKQAALTTVQSHQVAEIMRASRHMRDVVNVVLDYARLEALGPTLHMRPVVIGDLIDECMAVVRPEAAKRGLKLGVSVGAGTPPRFTTDEVHLRQILMNLLSNAVKYTYQGSVELRVAGDAEHLMFEVVDTGIGVPEIQRHHLFKEYARLGVERTCIEGTGIGLAIAHRLARRMGGHLGYRDNLAGGSVFWLKLPAGEADLWAPVIADGVATAAGPARTVLVVDDSVVNRTVTAGYLCAAGHSVVEAHDGNEAVRLAAAQDFDVVLMDMRMAGMDGLEATRRIRTLDGARGRVPIVAVTANALDEHADACRRAGMSDHLAKPFSQAELLKVVERAARQGWTFGGEASVQLADVLGEEAVQRLRIAMTLRIEALLRRLEEPVHAASTDELAELAHEIVGSGGTLGVTRLAAAARRFEVAVRMGNGDVAELRREAEAALQELRQRHAAEAMLPV